VAFFHTLYGLTVESEFPLPGTLVASATGPADAVVRQAAKRRPVKSPIKGLFDLSLDNGDHVFDFPDGVQVVVAPDARLIELSWPAAFTSDYASTYLMNVVMSFVMRIRGHATLHASAVLIDGAAVVFLGVSGAGKSTIAAMLAQRGFPVITEDVTAIVDRGTKFDVVSAHPRVRLWPDVATLLFGSAEALPLIANAEWKRYYDVSDRFAHGTFEIAAIYSIDDRTNRPPRVEPLEGSEALLDLIAASYKQDLQMSSGEFDLLGRMARHVPTRLVVPNANLATAPAMIDAILADVRAGRMSQTT
jgi:hypothetical protein